MNLKFEDIKKAYSKKLVLEDINFDFSQGNCFCLLGINGVGKSTLLNLILQFISPDSGRISYDGISYNSLPGSIKQRIGFLSEKLNLIDELSLSQYLRFIGKIYKIESNTLQLRIKDLYNLLFGEEINLINKRISSYSSGMRTKAALIAAILHLPDLLILDEPFSNLDPVSAQKVIELLNSYKKENRTIIFSSHNLDYIGKINPVILIMNDKKIVYSGTLENFTNNGKEKIDEALFRSLNVTSNNSYQQWI